MRGLPRPGNIRCFLSLCCYSIQSQQYLFPSQAKRSILLGIYVICFSYAAKLSRNFPYKYKLVRFDLKKNQLGDIYVVSYVTLFCTPPSTFHAQVPQIPPPTPEKLITTAAS